MFLFTKDTEVNCNQVYEFPVLSLKCTNVFQMFYFLSTDSFVYRNPLRQEQHCFKLMTLTQ